MINCIAVDDEMLALDLIEDNIKKIPFLNLIEKCTSSLRAIELLRTQKIDLVFLDIEMPDINGMQLVKGLTYKPVVIFITAYEKYAIDGYELEVLDYLLKPVSFERFLKSANKALDYIDFLSNKISFKPTGRNTEYIFVKSEHRIIKINISDIQYIESLKDYVKIYTSAPKPILSLLSLKYMEELLPEKEFIRVHRSFIISISKINYISRSNVVIGLKNIPVSTFYREKFISLINHPEI